MKNLIPIFVSLLLISGIAMAQEANEFKVNKDTKLVEATYFYESGEVSQEGTFNLKGELHGKWTSFNEQGQKMAMGYYRDGVKTGKWFFWTDEKLTEVDFRDNTIASVNEWTNTSKLAIREK